MRKLLWIICLVVGYFWLVKTGRDHLLLQKGRDLYKAVVTWLDEAEIDFQFKKEKSKKRSRRWD